MYSNVNRAAKIMNIYTTTASLGIARYNSSNLSIVFFGAAPLSLLLSYILNAERFFHVLSTFSSVSCLLYWSFPSTT